MSWKLVRVSTGETWAIPPPPRESSCLGKETNVSPEIPLPGDEGFCLGRGSGCGVHVASDKCSTRHLHFYVVPPPLHDVLLTPKQFPESSGPQVESLLSKVCGRLFVKCLSSSEVLVNGSCFRRVLSRQQEQPQWSAGSLRSNARETGRKKGERLQDAGYAELFPGDVVQLATDASLAFAVTFFPTAFSLGSNPDGPGTEESAETTSDSERRGVLRLLLEACRSAGIYLTAPSFHAQSCGLLLKTTQKPSISLLRCVLASKPLLDAGAVLQGLRRVSGAPASSETETSCSPISGNCLQTEERDRPFRPRIFFAGFLNSAALEQLQRSVSAAIRERSSESQSCGDCEFSLDRQTLRDTFFVQPPEDIWVHLLSHLACATLGKDISLPRLKTGSDRIQSTAGETLLTALKLFAPELPAKLNVLRNYVTSVPGDPLTSLFQGCLALTLSDACARRMSLLFEEGGGSCQSLWNLCPAARSLALSFEARLSRGTNCETSDVFLDESTQRRAVSQLRSALQSLLSKDVDALNKEASAFAEPLEERRRNRMECGRMSLHEGLCWPSEPSGIGCSTEALRKKPEFPVRPFLCLVVDSKQVASSGMGDCVASNVLRQAIRIVLLAVRGMKQLQLSSQSRGKEERDKVEPGLQVGSLQMLLIGEHQVAFTILFRSRIQGFLRPNPQFEATLRLVAKECFGEATDGSESPPSEKLKLVDDEAGKHVTQCDPADLRALQKTSGTASCQKMQVQTQSKREARCGNLKNEIEWQAKRIRQTGIPSSLDRQLQLSSEGKLSSSFMGAAVVQRCVSWRALPRTENALTNRKRFRKRKVRAVVSSREEEAGTWNELTRVVLRVFPGNKSELGVESTALANLASSDSPQRHS